MPEGSAEPNQPCQIGRSQKVLARLRKELVRHARQTHDLGYLPEYEAWQAFEGSSGWDVGKSGKIDLELVRKAASGVGSASEKSLLVNLQSQNEHVRYWGAIGFDARKGKLSEKAEVALAKALKDSSPSVRIEAANALARKNGIERPARSDQGIGAQEPDRRNACSPHDRAPGGKGEGCVTRHAGLSQAGPQDPPPDLSPVIVLPGTRIWPCS